MSETPEFIEIASITDKTLLKDGGFSLNILDREGKVRVIEFKPDSLIHLFQCLLPPGSAITGTQTTGFPAELERLARIQSGDLAMTFRLAGGLAIAIVLSPRKFTDFREALSRVEPLQ